MNRPMPPPTLRTALRQHWKTLAPRERSLVLAAAGLVTLALLWWLAIAPAMATLRTAPARHATLDMQLQHMRRLQAEAQQLQAAPRSSPGDAAGALRAALAQQLGHSAQLNMQGAHANVTLQGACADALAQWLAQARSNAHANTLQAQLTRSAATTSTPSSGGGAAPATTPCRPGSAMPRWDGTLVLVLPAPAP
ncbi:type II secretion system protein M [Verminephrobacter eiseniae]|uniref:type II secretion system protein M n=1 Tax=Verminephrobacter eiseniae TaxID=364317 RepID=UPI0022379F89|nr:type II secretion system protein M [Verminephrobacter eiseniae]MCW5237772.1 type II secretion system protein M [Verminephrobacter eiseniae]